MGGQARDHAARTSRVLGVRSRLLGVRSDVTVQGSGFAVTWKRFADSAPEVERTLARLAGQGPGWICTPSD